ncbi:HAD family hydrolase [Aquimarina sp. M1]
MTQQIGTILWDFDGVILDSMQVRDWGFKEIFKNYPEDLVKELIIYHRINGGLSRYVKIRYFYEKILRKTITEDKIFDYANQFSILMKKRLVNPDNLITDSVDFIKANFQKYNFHIVSGSDQKELRFLCKELGIDSYFISIHGSPTPKTQLVSKLIEQYHYKKYTICLIGDSMNDYEAANVNRIAFYGYNNIDLKSIGDSYISSFNHL